MTAPTIHPQSKIQPQAGTEIATLAGGCFWGMEDLIRKLPGVLKTEVGYTGGALKNPGYHDVKHGDTGHAESIQIQFDPKQTSFQTILEFFFKMHDPTTEDRQGNDRGTQYRSAIFFHSDEQKATAEAILPIASQKWGKQAVTEVTPASLFYPAEDYHQDYLEKNPNGYTCHFLRSW